ncbi:MAG: hypothetical protein ILP16_09525 [Spirochaetales bacterium]|nr:hypothetical protein [Spirochaetales bacterium]
MDFGEDVRLDDDRDIIFTAAGDVETVSGAALVAQDVREEISIYLGSVFYDRSAGSTIIDHLNATEDPDILVMNELERVALRDKRVDASSVGTNKTGRDRYMLSFRVVGYLEPQQLLFDLAEILGGNANA